MVLLKENELHINQTAASFKTSKKNINKWKDNIKEHYESLDYKTTEKDINNGTQQTFENLKIKTTFDYYNTGRIVAGCNNKDKLQLIFIENHETILGVKLNIVATEEKHDKSMIPTLEKSYMKPLEYSTPKINGNTTFDKLTSKDFTRIKGHEIIFENFESEIKLQKDEIAELKSEITALKLN